MSNARKIRKARNGSETERFDLDNYQPVTLRRREEDEEVEMLHVFSIDNKDYYMPTEVPFHTSVKIMKIVAEQGEAAAADFQLRALLGKEAYEALMDFEDLEPEDFENILRLANQIVAASAKKGKAG